MSAPSPIGARRNFEDSLTQSPDPPDFVPARMVGEVLFCERALYLEWIQGEVAGGYVTSDGRAANHSADGRQSALATIPATVIPVPSEEKPPETGADDELGDQPPPYQVRSIWLSDDRLRLTARIDLLDGAEAQVVPVVYKRGHAPDIREGAHLPERAQLAAQAMLLEAHGYQVEHGEVYFARDRRQIRIALDAELRQTVRDAVSRVLALTRTATIPPPLVASPKCRECSLVGLCLPDETRLLQRMEDECRIDSAAPEASEPEDTRELRRLHPARDERVPLYVQAYSGKVRLEGERLLVQTRDAKSEARLPALSQVAIYGNVEITAPALAELLDRGIGVSLFSYGGWYRGRIVHHDSKNIELRVAQFAAFAQPEMCLRLACGIVASKILNGRTILRRNAHDIPEPVLAEFERLARDAIVAQDAAALLGLEGHAARTYFQSFTRMLKPGLEWAAFDFTGRNRRPPRDPVNALLSFLYALLVKEWTHTLASVGLDPLLGFYHRPRYGRPALALDMMEEFRPIVADSVALQLLNNGVVGEADFDRGPGACALRPAARKRLIHAYERRMDSLVTHPVFGYRISYRRVLEVQARLLGWLLLGEIETLPPFRTR